MKKTFTKKECTERRGKMIFLCFKELNGIKYKVYQGTSGSIYFEEIK